jgi:hypothetical protein
MKRIMRWWAWPVCRTGRCGSCSAEQCGASTRWCRSRNTTQKRPRPAARLHSSRDAVSSLDAGADLPTVMMTPHCAATPGRPSRDYSLCGRLGRKYWGHLIPVPESNFGGPNVGLGNITLSKWNSRERDTLGQEQKAVQLESNTTVSRRRRVALPKMRKWSQILKIVTSISRELIVDLDIRSSM